jgi:Periplasmic copper-binding protein (NosD)
MSIGKMKALRMLLIVATALLVCYAAPSAQASTVVVGTCITGLTQFATIQAAVTAVPAGSTILVCPGNYPEQVTIGKALNLKGVSSGTLDAPTVVSPVLGMVQNATSLSTGNPIAAQILVQSTTGVNISRISLDGSNNLLTGCAPDLMGIYYQNASGTVTNVVIRNEALTTSLNGCQSGLGVFVQSGNAGASTVTVSASTVRNYQKNGITGNEAGTNVTISNNTVVGQGPTTGAAENGVQIGFGAAGKVTGNTIIDDIYAPGGTAAAGVLVFASNLITVMGNSVGNTQLGIAIVTDTFDGFGTADGAIVTGNKVYGTQLFDAIDLCSNMNTAQMNTISGNAESGVHLDSGCTSTGNNNTVTKNTIQEACAGILEGTGTGPNITAPNTFFDVTNTTLAGDTCSPLFTKTRKTAPEPFK